jgi:uncharacterized membrane protein YeaQ/YmgE (transglycosylase-associated protein family)
MLIAVLALMVAGFVTGGLARLAVPGPDPMPVWLTVAIGMAGSWGGGAIAAAVWGWDSTTAVSLFGFLAAIVLVVLYRRFIQGRPVTGPDAMKFPERGVGIDRFKDRRHKMEEVLQQQRQQQAAQTHGYDDVTEQIRKLGELREQGVLTDDEFQAKKTELLSRL